MLRYLTEEGVVRFNSYLQKVKENREALKPDLNVAPYSAEFIHKIAIDENIIFNTGLEMVKYLDLCFNSVKINKKDLIEANSNSLWTWLAYAWFEQLTNARKNIHENSRYICSSDYFYFWRHCIAEQYYIYLMLGEINSRLFLYLPPSKSNDFIRELARFRYIISYPNIIEAADILYWDNKRNAPKRGAQSRKREGCHRRFVKVISQIELTYDIYSMKASEILNILPREFDSWKN